MTSSHESLVAAESAVLDELHQRIAAGNQSPELLRNADLPTAEEVLIDAGLRLLPILEDEVSESAMAGRLRAIMIRLEYVGEGTRTVRVVEEFRAALALYRRNNRVTAIWVIGLLLATLGLVAGAGYWWWSR